MIAKIQKWDSSQGLRLSKALLSELGIAIGDTVDVTVRNGTLVLTPTRRTRGVHDLRELVRRIPKVRRMKESGFGPPVGREEW